ncbi:MAG TPA: HEPN domain-containing protein [Ignavibacteria bacterium]|nr:HEPN domain-containing protein [Ignavibacteria bacterium]
MITSKRYDTLVNRINQLNIHLLPKINLTAEYDGKDQDLIRSFCLLCHAEIEAYIEDYTMDIISKAFEKWDLNKKKISTIIFHLAYNHTSKSKELPYSMVVQSFNAVKKNIETNNGIRENNLIGIFRPIGFEIDPTLKSTLNDFGKTRGQIAHTSFQTQQPFDPKIEENQVKLILEGLKTFDRELYNYENMGEVNNSPVTMQWEKYNFIQRLKILFTGRT